MTAEQDNLERVADVQRAGLVRTLDALEEKRHTWQRDARRAALPLGALVAGMAIAASTLAFLWQARRERRPRRHPLSFLRSQWRPPPARTPSLAAKLAERVVLAAAGAIMGLLGKLAAAAVVPSKRPDAGPPPRLAPFAPSE